MVVVVVVVVFVAVLGFYVPQTAKIMRCIGLKSRPNDWRSPRSNPRTLVYKLLVAR